MMLSFLEFFVFLPFATSSFSIPHLIGNGTGSRGFLYRMLMRRAGVREVCFNICPHLLTVILLYLYNFMPKCTLRLLSCFLLYFYSLFITAKQALLDISMFCTCPQRNRLTADLLIDLKSSERRPSDTVLVTKYSTICVNY